MTTLYRKYRPSTFADVVDQAHIVTTIKNEIALGSVAHAYLFSGPRGVGKTTMARLLAKAVNCLKRKAGDAEACNECSACTDINAGRHIDVIEVDAASQTGVDNVRENIIENAQFKPTTAAYKVFIIDEVHMLSNSSFNALLKTLEEPPAHVLFILATTELHKLPATVISRCQRFTFKKIGYDLMLEQLQKICKEEKIKVDKEVLDRIINKSDGCLRDAESLLGQIFSLNLKTISAADAELILPTSNVESVVAFVEFCTNAERKEALNLITQLVEDGASLDQFAYDLLEVLRAIMIMQATGETKNYESDYSEQVLKRLKKIASDLTPSSITNLIDRALKRRLEIKTAPLPQLPLELFVIEAAQAPAQTSNQTTSISSEKLTAPTLVTDEPKSAPSITASIKNAINHLTHHNEPITTTLEQIQAKWNEVVDIIGKQNHSLTFILKMCALQAVSGNMLNLTVPYGLHRDKIEERKNKTVIEQALFDCFKEKILVSCAIAEEKKDTAPSLDLTNLAAEFGGEIVG